jgi:hypothetical protein
MRSATKVPTSQEERKRGDLGSFSLSKGRWTQGTQPTLACLIISGFARSVPAKLAENQSEAGCSVSWVGSVTTQRLIPSPLAARPSFD